MPNYVRATVHPRVGRGGGERLCVFYLFIYVVKLQTANCVDCRDYIRNPFDRIVCYLTSQCVPCSLCHRGRVDGS